MGGPEWFSTLRKYLVSGPQAKMKLRILIDLTAENCRYVLESLISIRLSAKNITGQSFHSSEFKTLEMWTILGKCAMMVEIDLIFDEQFLLTQEHLLELLPVCKQYHYFHLTNLKMSFRTCSLLHAWICTNMPRLQHAESLQNVTFISESDQRRLLSLSQ